MAATSELTSLKIRVGLNNGTTTTGSVKVAWLQFPSVDVAKFTTASAASNQKVLNIVNKMTPILAKSLYVLNRVDTYDIYDNA